VSDTALLVVDMLNAYRHEDADALADSVVEIVPPLAGLIDRARERDGTHVIYVNDNYVDFTAGRDAIVKQALDGARPELVEPIVPDTTWPFLEKGGAPQRLLRHLLGLPADQAENPKGHLDGPGDRTMHPL
jgi:nicotinamidase-related amidase